MINLWNAWHGCHKISAGCQNCYMFLRDAKYGKDSTIVTKTLNFKLPLMKKKDGYDNATICSTCENQEMADYRLSIMIELPIKHMEIIHEPMLEAIDINKYL